MSTSAQAAANLANAQASTGPTTAAGKERSSHNALKHGLTASTVLIPGEDPAEYEKFKQDLTAFWAPQQAAEIAFIDEMISVQWRLKRCERLEANILSADVPDFKALNNISLHAARLKRQYSATMKEFIQVAQNRAETERRQIQQAQLIRRADVLQKRPTDFSEFGFDFTVDFIDASIRRQDRLDSVAYTFSQTQFRQAA
jgi:hypothetical protein